VSTERNVVGEIARAIPMQIAYRSHTILKGSFMADHLRVSLHQLINEGLQDLDLVHIISGFNVARFISRAI
jgi:hypothetical protein